MIAPSTRVHMTRHIILFKALVLLALLFATRPAVPYSVQTHESLIDLAWKQSIRSFLLQRFPALTELQIQEAHAYAYGGCNIQDFGYYPFANDFFSDLTHYVRSGDFVLSLLRNAQTPDELAFAIGALSHYIGDSIGHDDAVNQSVAIEFPKLEKEYGPVVNYAQNPHAHVQVEFAFDINQLSKYHFAPSDYLEHVGLKIPARVLRRAFFETYGLHLPGPIGTRDVALRTYRFAVRSFLPAIARAETILHKFPPEIPSEAGDQLTKALRQAEAENGWEQYRKNPGIGSHALAGLIFILPKVGTLALLKIRGPNPQTEDLYINSVNRSIAALRLVLANFGSIFYLCPKPGPRHGEEGETRRLQANRQYVRQALERAYETPEPTNSQGAETRSYRVLRRPPSAHHHQRRFKKMGEGTGQLENPAKHAHSRRSQRSRNAVLTNA
jgi:hypothetical protein